MFSRIARFVIAHPRKVCAAWVLVAVGLALVVPDWRAQVQDDDVRFLPAGYPSVRGYLLLEKAFPKDVFASRAIFAIDRPDSPLTSDDFALVDRMTAALKALMH